MRVAAGTILLLLSLIVGIYGVWLITTVPGEFAPRGSVGVACVAASAIVGLSALALRRRGGE
jgi:Mg2+ and Co2+ transporter CorA